MRKLSKYHIVRVESGAPAKGVDDMCEGLSPRHTETLRRVWKREIAATLKVGNEPRDIAYVGGGEEKSFPTCDAKLSL